MRAVGMFDDELRELGVVRTWDPRLEKIGIREIKRVADHVNRYTGSRDVLLENQKVYGWHNRAQKCFVRGLVSTNQVTALYNEKDSRARTSVPLQLATRRRVLLGKRPRITYTLFFDLQAPHPTKRGTMSEAQETQATESPTSPSCCSTSRPGCRNMRWIPILLLVAAAGLYLRDMRAARQRTEAANAVRSQLAVPIAGVSVSHKLEGRTLPFLVRCPVHVATNLLAAIAQAQPTRFPKGTVEGNEFEIHLVQTNATFSILRAVVLNNDPETLFVGVKTPATKGADGKVTDWKVTQPAKVPGAGILMGELLKNIQNAAAQLPPDADVLHSMSNAAQRASTPEIELPLDIPIRTAD